jgi:hypothetical protein
MSKKTYEVIDSAEMVNLNNEVVKKFGSGDTVTGELVMIDEQPYIETPEGYVSTNSLAEKLSDGQTNLVEAEVKANSKKLIFALVGAGVGYAVAHFMKKNMKYKVMFTVLGLAGGLALEYINSKKK